MLGERSLAVPYWFTLQVCRRHPNASERQDGSGAELRREGSDLGASSSCVVGNSLPSLSPVSSSGKESPPHKGVVRLEGENEK